MKVDNDKHDTMFTGSHKSKGKKFKFKKHDGTLSVLEDQWSAKNYLSVSEIDLHAQGLKCDYIFSNWTLASGESLVIDPTTLTVYSGSTGDGYVMKSGTVWTTVHDAASGDSADDTANTAKVHSYKNGSTYSYARGFFPFDTSSLPDNAVIHSATLNFTLASNDTSVSLCLVQTTQGSPTNLGTLEIIDWFPV